MTTPVTGLKNDPSSGRLKPIHILALVFVANGLAYSFFVVTLPSTARLMGLSDTQGGLILALSALVITLMSPVWGSLCERYGRRPVILLGILATLLFNSLSAVAVKLGLQAWLSVGQLMTLLLLIRITNSLFTAGLKPAGQAYIADITHPQQRAKGMGIMGATFGVGAIVGGAIATASGTQHLILGYMAVSVLIALACLIAWLKLPESQAGVSLAASDSPAPSLSGSNNRLPYGQIWPFLLITLLGLTIFSLLQQVTALRIEDQFGLSADSAVRLSGSATMVSMLVMIFTQLVIVRNRLWSPSSLLLVGAAVGTLSMLGATLAPAAPYLIASMALFGLGLGLLLPGNLAWLSLTTQASMQAKVAGVNGVSQGLGLAAGPIVGASLHQLSPLYPYLACALLLICVFFLALAKHKNDKKIDSKLDINESQARL